MSDILRTCLLLTIVMLLVLAGSGRFGSAQDVATADVRVAARWLDDGRVEFGLQQKDDGRWQERILPASRFYRPVDGRNRWANSSLVSVPVVRPAMPPRDAPANELQSGQLSDATFYRLDRTASGRIDAVVVTVAPHQHGLNGLVGLQYSCYGDHMWLAFGFLPQIKGASTRVSWQIDGGTWQSQTWDAAYRGVEVGWVVSPRDDFALLRSLRGANQISLSVASDVPVSATFNPAQLFRSPVQRYLDECVNPLTANADIPTNVRISARLAESGWIEFAVQQRTPDDQWLDRLLPSGRFLPPVRSDADIGRWLVSGIIRIERDSAVNSASPIRGLDGWTKEGVRFWSRVVEQDDLSTVLIAVGRGGGPPKGELWLSLACADGTLSAALGGWDTISGSVVNVRWRVDDGNTYRDRWAAGQIDPLGEMVAPSGQAEFIDALTDAQVLHVVLEGPREQVGWIPLDGFFSTPAQPNLIACGQYTVAQTTTVADMPSARFQPLLSELQETPDGVAYRAQEDQAEGQVESSAWVWSQYSEQFGGVGLLQIECSGGRLWLAVKGYAHISVNPVAAVWQIDGGRRVSEQWDSWFGSARLGYTASPQLDWQVIKHLFGSRQITIWIHDEAPLTFRLAGLLSTPIQPNLDHCGAH